MPLILMLLIFWLPLALYRRAVWRNDRPLEAAEPAPLERYEGNRNNAIQAEDWRVE
ncbi:MAG: hypothetical protein IJ157_03005 [Clostridia bacterium]|nr:hypothetical protein [Clostridia bacterium]